MQKISQVQKAIAAFVFAGAGALGTAAVEDGVQVNEWYVIVAAALAAGAAVYYTPNESA